MIDIDPGVTSATKLSRPLSKPAGAPDSRPDPPPIDGLPDGLHACFTYFTRPGREPRPVAVVTVRDLTD